MSVGFRSDNDGIFTVVVDGEDIGWLFPQYKYGFSLKSRTCGLTITPADFVAIADKIRELQETNPTQAKLALH